MSKQKLPKGYVEFGKTVSEVNGLKTGDYIIPMMRETWGPGVVVKILLPWTILDSSMPEGLKRFGHHVVAIHQIRNGSRNPGESQWPLDVVEKVSATEASALSKAMLLPTSRLLRLYHLAFNHMNESQEALDAYAYEIDRRFPRPIR